MRRLLSHIRFGFLSYLVPILVYWPIIWLVSLIIQKNHNLLNALYAYTAIVGFMVFSLIVNFIIAQLDFERPWWLKIIFTVVFGVLFTPVYLFLAPLGLLIISLFPTSGCVVTSFLAKVSRLTVGLFVSYRGDLTVLLKNNKAIVAFNHRGSGDYIIAPDLLGFNYWRIMIGKNLWRYGIFRGFFNAIGLPIAREKDAHSERSSSVRKSIYLFKIKKKIKIGVFIEGTRNRDDKNPLLPAKYGAFNIACQSGVPIIPVVMINTQKWRRPSDQNTSTYIRFKKKLSRKEIFLKVLNFPISFILKIKDSTINIFREGINPTVVRIYLLSAIPTIGKTPKQVKEETEKVMTEAYIKYAKIKE